MGLSTQRRKTLKDKINKDKTKLMTIFRIFNTKKKRALKSSLMKISKDWGRQSKIHQVKVMFYFEKDIISGLLQYRQRHEST